MKMIGEAGAAWFALGMEELFIRPAARDDLAGIVSVYNEAVQDTAGTYDAEPHSLEERVAWFVRCEAKGYPILVEDAVRGWGSMSPFVERSGFRHTAICAVYVAEAARGHGLGTALLEALLAEAVKRGLHTVLAAIDVGNAASLRLHEKLGFSRVGTFREIGWKADRWHDVVYLQRMV